MGRSSPPFLYDRPSAYSFYGPTDKGFNPKAATEASWTRPAPKSKPTGPLVNLNRHPDTWGSFNTVSSWIPMSPYTKDRVKWARIAQLTLRVLTLLGALGSLFCSIVITGAAATVIWIIRVGPIVSILHTIYGICHHARSPITRPSGSQAAYGLFASTLDLGLIAFYVFTAFIAYGEWTSNAYNWGTMFKNSDITVKLSETTFILALANGGLHLISFFICIFFAITFRKISRLPPDMNPLEDNLTARPRKGNREKADTDEKHLSQSTLNSSMEDPLIGRPRSMPFMHTREQSLGGGSNHAGMDMMNDHRQSQPSFYQHRLSHLESPTESHMEPSSPEMLFHQPESQPYDITSQTPTPAPEYRKVASHAPEIINATAQMRHLSSRTADRSDNASPLSDNWVAYSERSQSPMSEALNGNENTLRQSSSVYSRRSNTSTGSGIRDWFAYGSKPAPSIGNAIPEDVRGEYASLATHEYYGNDGNQRELDVGDQRMDIFPDPEEHKDDMDDEHNGSIPFNPLMLNPPTPRPILTEKPEDTDPVRRIVLSDNPNLSYNGNAQPVSVPHKDADSPPPGTRFYGELDVPGKPGLDTTREPSYDIIRKPTKLKKKRTKKMSAYEALKKDESDGEDGYIAPRALNAAEGDRQGRVVSNSGADTARPGIAAGVGASLSSYGSYIAGLGVGRRRDVSGKVAEEGRSEPIVEEMPTHTQNQTPGASPVRAAGWARFAGL
ncbi:hypothetical protein PENARI_c007G09717 [Penicillium arizonense]|uniref:Uncharacterized protein n=1 Tax=Penicillium arizonense TaxID=1835702 RepID=A0A1F5LKM4_PENAI|nr:hypothetical protein PENARI_c007G09717 [Penicillium arizonense]OGE53459.1 hypothetical protein PENARI_c007G09717 [Penicillium arizonense]